MEMIAVAWGGFMFWLWRKELSKWLSNVIAEGIRRSGEDQ